MKTWEYSVVELPVKLRVFTGPKTDCSQIENLLNLKARDGWELVETVPTMSNGFTHSLVFTFRREQTG